MEKKSKGLIEVVDIISNSKHITKAIIHTDKTTTIIEKGSDLIPTKPKGNYEWNGKEWEATDNEGYYLDPH